MRYTIFNGWIFCIFRVLYYTPKTTTTTTNKRTNNKKNNNKQTQNPKQTNPPKNQQQQKQQQQHKTPDRSNRPCMRFLVRDDKYSNIAKKKKKKNRLAPKSYEVDICHGLILLSVLINVNSKACTEHSISEFSL